MKLVQTKDYLLLIDEEAEIKPDDYIIHDTVEGIVEANDEWHYRGEKDNYWNKVIAFYPLTKEAKELDLPLLPPFEEDVVKLADEFYKNHQGRPYAMEKGAWREGYKAAQAKQFSLKDMKDILEEGLNWFGGGRDKEIRDSETWFNHYIQSLSTQKLPKEFVGWLSKKKCPYDFTSRCTIDRCDCEFVFETITNSKGKQELVGTYKY